MPLCGSSKRDQRKPLETRNLCISLSRSLLPGHKTIMPSGLVTRSSSRYSSSGSSPKACPAIVRSAKSAGKGISVIRPSTGKTFFIPWFLALAFRKARRLATGSTAKIVLAIGAAESANRPVSAPTSITTLSEKSIREINSLESQFRKGCVS